MEIQKNSNSQVNLKKITSMADNVPECNIYCKIPKQKSQNYNMLITVTE